MTIPEKYSTINFERLFNVLSEPMSCGAIDSNGVRYQVHSGERSSERIFILSDDITSDKPNVLYRSYFDTDGSWRSAISAYLRTDRVFKHPVASIFCIERDIVTVRQINFDLDIIKIHNGQKDLDEEHN